MTAEQKKKFVEICTSISPDKPISDSQLKKAYDLWLRYQILNDLYFFGAEVMKWKDAKRGKRKRLQPKLHSWLARLLEQDEDALILIARLHLKSTWVKLRIVQKILQDPNIRIALVSETSNLVEEMLTDIKRMLSHPIIVRLFPDIVPEPGDKYQNWEVSRADRVTTKRDPSKGKVPQEPQVRAFGVGTVVQGMHVDIAFADDIIGPDSVTTANQMQKTEEWWAYFQSVIEIDAPVLMTGTFYHYSDVYNKIIKEKQFKRVYRRPAMENGNLIYSNWFTKADLEKIKKRQGDYIYNCQYMLDPMPQQDRIFPPPQPTHTELPEGEYSWYMAIDPAFTTKKWSDYTGITIGCVDKNDKLWVERSEQVKLSWDPRTEKSAPERIVQLATEYPLTRVGMEAVMFEQLGYIIEAKVTEWENETQTTIPALHNILPIPIPRALAKAQRINLTLGMFIRERRASINDKLQDLLFQMEFFSGEGREKDDLVDSAAMLIYLHDRFAQHYWVDKTIRKTGMSIRDFMRHGTNPSSWEERFVS